MAEDVRPSALLSAGNAPEMTAKTWTLVAAVLGSSIVFLDSAVLTVAIKAIGEQPRLFVSVLEGQNYIQFGYLLTLSTLLILSGALSDYYGRKRLFVIGLVGFGATSLLCAIAPNIEFLIVARLLQGASGAILVPGSLAILSNNFQGEEQGRAFGIWAAASGAAPIFGPFIGGLLVDYLSWRWIFALNLPLIAVAVWAARRYVAESRDEHSTGDFDWLGAFLVAVAVGGLSFGAIYGEQRQWQDPLAFAVLGIGAVVMVALPFYFARRKNPLVPLSLFRSRNFSVTNVSTLVIYGALYTVLFFLPLFMLGVLGYSAAGVGIALIFGPIFLLVLSTRFGTLSARAGPRWFMTIGPLLMAAGVAWYARLPADSQPWNLRLEDSSTYLPPTDYLVDILPASLVFGLGLAVMVAPLTTALMRSVPSRRAGIASAFNNAVSRVGPQLAGALIFVVITQTFYASLATRVAGLDTDAAEVRETFAPLNPVPEEVPGDQAQAATQASTDAFHLAMLTGAGLLVVGAVVNGLGIDNRQALSGAHSSAGTNASAAPP